MRPSSPWLGEYRSICTTKEVVGSNDRRRVFGRGTLAGACRIGNHPDVILLLALASATPPSAIERPRTYLASVVGFPLKSGESLELFSIATWGVEFAAVCKIPAGWRIEAGSSATPDGILKGSGSLGATWFNRSSPPELRNFALVTLYGPVQRQDIRSGADATFKGYAVISTDDGDKKVALDYRNVRLTPARRCP